MTGSSKRHGRPPIYDPAIVRRLLAERDRSGGSYAELSLRSSIPAGALATGNRKRNRPAQPGPVFAELLSIPKDPTTPTHSSGVTVEFLSCEPSSSASHSNATERGEVDRTREGRSNPGRAGGLQDVVGANAIGPARPPARRSPSVPGYRRLGPSSSCSRR